MVQKESSTCPSGDLFSGPVNIKWEEGTPAPVGYTLHTAVWLNGLVYVGGGLQTGYTDSYTINCYDPASNSWSSAINTPHSCFAMTTLNNKLLIAGGIDKHYKVTTQILMMETSHLKNYTKMITARSSAVVAGHQRMLIITGGEDGNYIPLSSTELFDSKNKRSYTCGDLPQPHRCLQSVIVDNVLYLLGGINKDGNSPTVFTASLDTLSSHCLKWNTHQDTPWCRSAPVNVNNTQLLIVGGCKNGINSFTYTSAIYKFSKDNHSWENIGNIPSARGISAVVSIAANRIIVIGGRNNKVEYTNTVWIGTCEPQ